MFYVMEGPKICKGQSITSMLRCNSLESYVLRDGGAKDLQRAEYHFNAAMQLAVGFGMER